MADSSLLRNLATLIPYDDREMWVSEDDDRYDDGWRL
jgi:hypothetical protein